MSAPTIISAPQGIDITDDSKDLIVSRTIARLQARGLDIEYLGVDDWAVPTHSGTDVRKYRTWELSVTKDGKSLGEMLVRETWRAVQRGRKFEEVLCSRVLPNTKDIYDALGLKWNDGN